MPQTSIADKILEYLKQEETDYEAAAQLGEAAIPVLKGIMQGQNEALASKAASLAGMIGGPGGTEVLEEAAKHQSDVVRVAAAAAAQKLTTDQSERVLSRLIDDPDLGVAKLTLRSVREKNLTHKFAVRIRDISDHHPQEAIKMMARSMLQ